MDSFKVREKFIEYYKRLGHSQISSTPLVLENDPTTLFVSSGMQPLIPYLLGKKHPLGDRLVDSQACIRAQGFLDDMMEVGDNRHLTFFEMLGNWSLGSYFKREQLNWVFKFFVDEIGLDPNKLYVTVFSGDKNSGIPEDNESKEIWEDIFLSRGISIDSRIYTYGVEKNWWSRSGKPKNMPAGEPGGPDSEIFYDFGIEHNPKFGEICHPNCDCGRFLEIGNSVFMQYVKLENGMFSELAQKNVDFGGGLERIVAASRNDPDVFKSDLYASIIEKIEELSGKEYKDDTKSHMRITADHMKAAVFLILEGVVPSNKQQGYILRKFLRRSVLKMYLLNPSSAGNLFSIALEIINKYKMEDNTREKVKVIVELEVGKFLTVLEKGLREFNRIDFKEIDEKFAFNLFQSYGFPFEITYDLLLQKGKRLDKKLFIKEFDVHRNLSKTISAGMFKGGLGGTSEREIWYHTLTHILHQALYDVLGGGVRQEGSNINSERLRFDFSHDGKLKYDEVEKIESIVNKVKNRNLEVKKELMNYDDAIKTGAKAFFKERYEDKVSVYSIGDYSKEICQGPHVANTAEIKGTFKIVKEESVNTGTRRIKAIVEL